MSDTDIKIEKITTKPVKLETVLFTGKNGKAVAEYINSKISDGGKAKNGGSYVKISFDFGDHGSNAVIKKGEYIIPLDDGHFAILNEEELLEKFTKRSK